MSKVRLLPLIAIAAFAGARAEAQPAPARCGAGPALLVRVTGFKARSGTVRVQLYGGDPARWFDKHSYLRRVDLQAPRDGALDVCLPVPAPGEYAVSVRHDLNGSGKADRGDGGGLSGNPELSLFDMLLKRKPAPDKVAVGIARGVRLVPVTLNYLSGTSFRPVAG